MESVTKPLTKQFKMLERTTKKNDTNAYKKKDNRAQWSDGQLVTQ